MPREDEIRRLIDADRRFVWHPFTQMKDWAQEEDPVIIVEGRDVFLKDIRGRWFMDGVSSLWVNVHGHRRPELDAALREQIDSVAHSTLLGAGNVPSTMLAKGLAEVLGRSFGPAAPSRVFYSDNGSTAVEVALKMAYQYWLHKGDSGRHAFLSLEHAYHGDTLGAVSVGGIPLFHEAFGPLLFKSYRAPAPYCYRCELAAGDATPTSCGLACIQRMDEILDAHAGEIAALIIEPIMQAAGGMIASPPGYLRGVRDLCTKYGIPMIADEVATGFGRTGRMFACEREGVVPDIICLSKGLTGGYLPLAATVATEDIYQAFLGEFREMKTFFHGHSYTGNPLGCACALASMEIFEKEDTLSAMSPKIEMLERRLGEVAGGSHVGDVRQAGLMAGVELVRDKRTKEPYGWEERRGWRVAHAAREGGVLIRPLGNVVVIMPPLSIGLENLARMLDVIAAGIERATGD